MAVFLAAFTLAALMQGLVRQVVGLTLREMLSPLVPGMLAAVGTALVVGAVTVLGRAEFPGLPTWLLLLLQASIGGLFWLAFILFVRIRALQVVIDEVIDDVVPRPLHRLIAKVRPFPRLGETRGHVDDALR